MTGGLLFTRRHFAQVLEGEAEALAELLGEIAGDGRHSGMNILYRRPIASRFFFDWSMAYNGPSRIVDRHIAPLVQDELTGIERELAAQDLLLLMKEFALLRDAA